MEYRLKGKSSLKSLHPYRKPKEKKLLKIPLAYGRAGIENLIKLLTEEISEPALVNTLSLIRDEMNCQEIKTRAIELNLVRVLGRGLRRDWMISEYLTDEEAKHLIRARSLTLDILGDVSAISYGRDEMKSQNVMPLIVKELTSKYQCILASATNALSRWTDFTQGAELFLKEKIEKAEVTPQLENVKERQDVALWMTRIFANITGLASDDGVNLALRLNVPKQMSSFLCLYQGNEKLVNATLRVVCNVSHNIKGNAEILNHRTMEAVCDLISSSSFKKNETIRLASGALKAMAITEDGKRRVARKAVDVVSKLVASKDEFTKTNAVCCIQLASEFPVARTKFVHELLRSSSVENLKLVFQERCMKELTKIMLSEDSSLEFKTSALEAFSEIVKTKSGIKEATQCVCLVEAISSLMLLSGNSRVSSLAGSTLAFLSKGNVVSAKQLAKFIVESGGYENDSGDDFGLRLKRKLAVYPGMAGRVLDHVKLFQKTDCK